MRFLFLLLLSCGFKLAFSQCGLQYHEQSAGIQQIMELESGSWIALAGNRQILRSFDRGTNWEILYDCDDLRLNQLFQPSPGVIYAAGLVSDYKLDRRHFLLKSVDYGDSWSVIHHPSESLPRSQYHFIGDSIIYTFGELGIIWQSKDGGLTWTEQKTDTFRELNVSYFHDELTGIIAGDNNSMFRTEDGGTHWQDISLPSGTGDITRLFFLTEQLGYLYNGSDIYQTKDGGISWTLFHDGTVRYFQSDPNGNIYFRDAVDKKVYVIDLFSTAATALISDIDFEPLYGKDVYIENLIALDGVSFIQLELRSGPVRRKMIRSKDNWQTWQEVPAPIDICRVPYSIFQSADGELHFHFHEVRNIYSSSDLGASWSVVSDMGVCKDNPSLYNISAFEAISEDVLYAGNVDGIFIRSTTGGDSWERLNISHLHDSPAKAIYFSDAMNGFIVDDKFVYETEDGGQTWEHFEHGQSIWELKIIDRLSWIVINKADRLLLKTLDGGKSWNQELLPDTGPGSSRSIASFIDMNTGFLIMTKDNYDRIYKTTDGGKHWSLLLDRRDTPQLSRYITAIQFLNEKDGAFGVSNGIIYKTTDGGMVWDSIKARPLHAQSITHIQFSTPEEGFVVDGVASNNISYTSDGGLTWQAIGIAGSYNILIEQLRDNAFMMATGDAAFYVVDQQEKSCLLSNIVGNTDVCRGSVNYYSAGIPALDWTLTGEGELYEDSSRMVRVRWQEAGDFQIQAQSLGCTAAPATSLPVRVYPPVERPKIYQPSDSLLRSTVSTDIQWYNEQGPISGATGTEFRPPAAGRYWVVADNQVCLAQSSQFFNFDFSGSITSTREDQQSSFPSVFPNPTTGLLSIQFDQDQQYAAELFNAVGQKQLMFIKNNQVDISSLPPGTYWLRIHWDNNRIHHHRIIKL